MDVARRELMGVSRWPGAKLAGEPYRAQLRRALRLFTPGGTAEVSAHEAAAAIELGLAQRAVLLGVSPSPPMRASTPEPAGSMGASDESEKPGVRPLLARSADHCGLISVV